MREKNMTTSGNKSYKPVLSLVGETRYYEKSIPENLNTLLC